ncbi:lipocalin family protein [Rufibacter soli]
MKTSKLLLGLGAGFLASGALYAAFRPQPAPLATVPSVDMARYGGTWYEIASFPQRFQRGCQCTQAQYTLKEGYVEVKNTCHKNGRLTGITGKAFPVAGSHNTKLKVQFFWPLRGDYWILDLDPDYAHVLVGTPDRKSLWILARATTLPAPVFQQLVQRAQQLGFDTTMLQKTDQSCAEKQ